MRIGNAAYGQVQLDIYGELLDSVYLYNKWGEPISYGLWEQLVRLIDWVCANWRRPDEGIWEVRGGQQEFLYSRLMCWVALDRGIRLANKRSFPAPLGKWIRQRDAIFHDIHTNFWDAQRGAFMQTRGSGDRRRLEPADAAGEIHQPDRPAVALQSEGDRAASWWKTRWSIATAKAQAAPDGFAGAEGTFCMCTFWYAECLARGGDVQQGRYIFEKMLGYANHVGLYAEQLGPEGNHLGNFPQAFTHLGLISAAYAIDHALEGTRRA